MGSAACWLVDSSKLVSTGCQWCWRTRRRTASHCPKTCVTTGTATPSTAIFKDTQYKLGFLDQAIGALIEELHDRGLDQRVMLVVTGEFGRTPKLEYTKGRPGRDHWPQAQSILVSGGAGRMGQVIGSTTAKAEVPKDRPMVPNHLWATVFQHLKINYKELQFLDGTGRPMPALPDGEPIAELL
jgi:hypothetical protein